MANSIVQTIKDAEVDARSLSEFISKDATFTVTRRLAPTIHTLDYYLLVLNNVKEKGDLADIAISDTLNKLEQLEPTVTQRVEDAINNTAVEGGVLADTFVTATANNGTVPRSQREINSEHVSVKSYGAIGDGTLHTVAEWLVIGSRVYYPTLAAIQVDYPHVKALTDSIDWAATQLAVTKSRKVYAPSGKYVLNKVVQTAVGGSSRIAGSASPVNFFGDGFNTVFTRNDIGEATRIYHGYNSRGLPITTRESDIANLEEACFAIHGTNCIFEDMSVVESRVAFFLGHDYLNSADTNYSNAGHTTLRNLRIQKCGTGVLGLAHLGNHYNSLDNVKFYANQIDVHLRSSYYWGIVYSGGRGDANNNRWEFSNLQSDSSKVGYWNQCGDTHNLFTWHFENANAYSRPTPLLPPHSLPKITKTVKKTFYLTLNGSESVGDTVNIPITRYSAYRDDVNPYKAVTEVVTNEVVTLTQSMITAKRASVTVDVPPASIQLIFDGSNQLNRVVGCHTEACEFDLYAKSYRQNYIANGFTTSRCEFVQYKPEIFSGTFSKSVSNVYSYADNAGDTLSANTPTAARLYLGDDAFNGVALASDAVYQTPLQKGYEYNGEVYPAKTDAELSFKKETQLELKSLLPATDYYIPIWDTDRNAASIFDVHIVGSINSGAYASGYGAKISIIGKRSAGGLLSHYLLNTEYTSRAYYETDVSPLEIVGILLGTVAEVEASKLATIPRKSSDATVKSGTLYLKIRVPSYTMDGGTVFITQYKHGYKG